MVTEVISDLEWTECEKCNGKGWVHIEGATKFPLTKDCSCRLLAKEK